MYSEHFIVEMLSGDLKILLHSKSEGNVTKHRACVLLF